MKPEETEPPSEAPADSSPSETRWNPSPTPLLQPNVQTADRPNLALILAAGASTRMGRCKASLPWLDGETLLTYQIQQWRLAGVSPWVVLGPHNASLQTDLPPGSRSVLNPHPSAGKTRSILKGLQALPAAWGVLAIAAVDQPRPAWIYQALLQAHLSQSQPISAPVYQGRMGHPLLFSPEMRPQLAAIREESQGLRQIIQAFRSSVHPIELSEPIVLTDLNTPEAYHRALQNR